MNKIIIIAMILSASFAVKAQVAIGKPQPVTITNSSVLLEFGSDAKGIIVPQVASAPGALGGTFIFNSTDKAMEVWEGRNNSGNGGWTNLTVNGTAGITHSFVNSGTDAGTGVIIGKDTTAKPGALVLESTDRALVLPQVANPHLTMKGVIAGTMMYDTTSDTLAVYDGANWSYWK